MEQDVPEIRTIAETENFVAWRADEPDGESTFNLELNNVTLHFFQEEWDEFLKLVEAIADEEDCEENCTIAETDNYIAYRVDEPDMETSYNIELPNVTLHFGKEDWTEIVKLLEAVVEEEL